MRDLHTRNCVRCLTSAAVVFSGHVTRGDENIFSGWCEPCLAMLQADAFKGWDGHWREEMGTQTTKEAETPKHLALVPRTTSPSQAPDE